MDDLLREMITPPAPRRDPARRRRLIGTAAILGMAGLGLTSLVTSAIFTDRADTGRTGITTGTVDIEAGQPAAFPLPVGNLAPGDETYSPVVVENKGSLALTYAVDYAAQNTAGGALAGQIGMQLYAVPAERCNATGIQDAAAIGAVQGLSTAGADLTDPAAPRSLIAGATEALCVRVTIPRELGNDFQASTVDLALTFDAEQDAQNPHRTS